MKRVPLIIATGLDMAFDYAVPDDKVLNGGEIMRVPFGKRDLLAVYFPEETTAFADGKTLQLEKLKTPSVFFNDAPFFYPPLTAAHRQFLLELSRYYGGDLAAPLGAVLKMALPVEKIFDETFLIKTMAKQTPKKNNDEGNGKLDVNLGEKHFALNQHQLAAIDSLKKNTTIEGGGGFSVQLLHGITGSGKTAVYFELMRSVLSAGKRVLVLLPEISLSTQWREKFYEFFGKDISLLEWHSHLTPRTRTDNFYQLLRGAGQVLVGARSSLLLPLDNLGLIVVDEEHDASYKQQSGVRYHARDMAILRAKLEQCPVILSTATPSLETRHHAAQQKYQRTVIHDRILEKKFPAIGLIDLRKDVLAKGEFISAPLQTAIAETLARGEQALLFINRRGFAPITLCTACGEKLSCRQCSAYLTHHARQQRYQCHQCDWFIAEQQLANDNGVVACPACHAENSLVAFGPGAERVVAEAQKKFPHSTIAMATSDTIKKESDLQQLINDMTTRKIDIVVGTQLLAKGHDFPYLSLVGVIATDQLFVGEDPRAMERAWQGLEQVIGRAGRHDKTSSAQALLQTYQPQESLLQHLVAGRQEEFWQGLMDDRQKHHLPPFGRLALVTALHKNESFLYKVLLQMKKQAGALLPDASASFKIYGPAPAPVARVRGLYRHRFLLMAKTHKELLAFCKSWLKQCDGNIADYKKIRIELDIDPQDFM
ncbi:MAG: primosomal protein N' [Hydrotalea sp.]|nr:primosomal protein N' [Hydrotalea sp.]